MDLRPPLSVVVAARHGLEDIASVLEALAGQAQRTGTELLVVGPISEQAPAGVRVVRVDDDDIYRLRLAGIEAATGEVIAIGEDHAVPRPDWCEAMIRAHAERPDAPAIVGCIANATDGTLSGRANFLAFAAPFEPPMEDSPRRPPPASTLSLKRAALEPSHGCLGHFESVLLPRLFEEGALVADDRIVADHFQDGGVAWSIANAFHSSRASYGYAARGVAWSERARRARWSVRNWPPRLFREARDAARRGRGSRSDLAAVAVIVTAAGVGGAVGSLCGPGVSPRRVA